MKRKFGDVTIRKFNHDDISNKVKWVNDPKNNTYLHYDLPLEYDKTVEWFKRVENDNNRYDAVIEYNGTPVGIVGLLQIDYKNKEAEDYMLVHHEYTGKGIATKAGHLIQMYGFYNLNLSKIYAYTEVDNEAAYNLDRRRGFVLEGKLEQDLIMNGKKIDRYLLGLYKDRYVVPEEIYEGE